jgi:hypothetical protein
MDYGIVETLVAMDEKIDQTIEKHDESDQSHTDIREEISELAQQVGSGSGVMKWQVI